MPHVRAPPPTHRPFQAEKPWPVSCVFSQGWGWGGRRVRGDRWGEEGGLSGNGYCLPHTWPSSSSITDHKFSPHLLSIQTPCRILYILEQATFSDGSKTYSLKKKKSLYLMAKKKKKSWYQSLCFYFSVFHLHEKQYMLVSTTLGKLQKHCCVCGFMKPR